MRWVLTLLWYKSHTVKRSSSNTKPVKYLKDIIWMNFFSWQHIYTVYLFSVSPKIFSSVIYLIKMKPKRKNFWALLRTPMIQYLVDLPLAAITWNNHFLYDFMSFTCCGGILGILLYNIVSVDWGLIRLCTAFFNDMHIDCVNCVLQPFKLTCMYSSK